jgi:hypothetical protein
MNGGEIVKWGLIGIAGWWVYETFFNTPVAAVATPAATTTTTTAAPVTTSVAAAPVATTPVAGGLDALYAKMVAAAQAANDPAVTSSGGVLSASGNVWNYYLAQVNPAVTSSLQMTNQADASQQYTSAAYWAIVGPPIGTALGLAGVRLGLAGLGAVIMRGRR